MPQIRQKYLYATIQRFTCPSDQMDLQRFISRAESRARFTSFPGPGFFTLLQENHYHKPLPGQTACMTL